VAHVWIKRLNGARELRPALEHPTAKAIAEADAIDIELELAMRKVLAELGSDSGSVANIIRRKWLFGSLMRMYVHPIAHRYGVDLSWIHRAAYSFTSPYLEISDRADRLGSDEISLCVILAATPWESLPGKSLRWADWWSILEAPNLRRDVRLIVLVAQRAEDSGARDVRALVTSFRKHFKNWDTTHLTDTELLNVVSGITV
jgi:hypothetical protein